MKKILCPTDFTEPANNGIEYAAEMAKKIGAGITLINVQSAPLVEMEDNNIGTLRKILPKKKRAVTNELQDYCLAISDTFKVECNYDLEVASIEKAIAHKAEADDYDLIIMGTNGADTMTQYFLGSHSYQVSKRVQCPVLIVPEGCSFNGINKIVYASDYHEKDSFTLQQLMDFAKVFNPDIQILHVSRKDTDVGQEVYHTFKNRVEEQFHYDFNVCFARRISKDEMNAVDSYMHEEKADLLAIMLLHPNLVEAFQTGLVKAITSIADYPVLVFHK